MSEGGLGPRSWWYIPEQGIHHHSKLTRQGPAGPAFRRRKRDASTGRPDRTRHVTCGNDGGGEPGPGRMQGRTAAAAARRFIIRDAQWQPPAAARKSPHRSRSPREPAQMTLAAELNPHKTELNPHKAVETASRAGTDQTGLPSSARARRDGSWQELSRRPRSAAPVTLRCRHGPRLRRVAVMYCDSPSTGSIRGAQNRTFCRGLSSGGCASKFGGRPSKPERGNGLGKRAGSFLPGR